MTDFLRIATPFAQLGIPVFPLMPGTKVPPAGLHWDKKATTDMNRIAEWDAANHDYNVGLAALPGGECCFLEFDVKGGMKQVVKDMNQDDIPPTRIQRSGKGGAHLIFRHTDHSRAIGNRSVNLPDGHEWFSFRADNKYLVGAGSLHPNGQYYKTLYDVDPIAIPDWVCDWIEANSHKIKAGGCDNTAGVSDEFDFDAFCEFYSISGRQDGKWFICDECPVAGYRHQGSTRTGFFYDGITLGFHCFAQGCEGSQMSIGKVIGYLNAQKGKACKGVIWGARDEKLDTSRWEIEIPDDAIEALGPIPEPEAVKPSSWEPVEITSMSDADRAALKEGDGFVQSFGGDSG
jgi:Bifunctional DNA primase/polymerase, N-terminal